MPRHINLRQVEAFKAVIENGTVSRAAEMLNISQPAVSKLIAHLEEDTGLKLFDRVKGRLAPTARGMRLYEEIDRIFAGIRQVENAVDTIRREQEGQLMIGVMPALSGPFIQQATMSFLQGRPGVFCSVQSRSSQWIVDWLVTRKLDVGLISSRIENPYVVDRVADGASAGLHHAARPRARAQARHQAEGPATACRSSRSIPESHTGQRVAPVFEEHGVRPNIVIGRQRLADAVRVRRGRRSACRWCIR